MHKINVCVQTNNTIRYAFVNIQRALVKSLVHTLQCLLHDIKQTKTIMGKRLKQKPMNEHKKYRTVLETGGQSGL